MTIFRSDTTTNEAADAREELRERIVESIRIMAAELGGRAPGKRAFESRTGFRESDWRGSIWARWSDAVADAGLEANRMQERSNRDDLMERLAEACRHYGRMPTASEFQLLGKRNGSFPSYKTLQSNFGSKAEMVAKFRVWLKARNDDDLLALVQPMERPLVAMPSRSRVQEGYVYLLRSGPHFKIGRSDELERRIKQISIALPESVKLVHAIRTDDPAGIEGYWHRRFSSKRANGEWFKLDATDLAAFKRRKFQ